MRAFLHLFFGLLIPLSALFMVLSFLYFSTEYDFTKSMRQGVLYGFFIAIFISLFIASLLFIMRNMQKIISHLSPVEKQEEAIQSLKKDTKLSNAQTTTPHKANGDIEYKLMLLMDKALAFEVSLYAISEKKIGTAKLDNSMETIRIHTHNGIIHLTVSTLTRHTSQIVIRTKKASEEIDRLITYIKEKELSFLQY